MLNKYRNMIFQEYDPVDMVINGKIISVVQVYQVEPGFILRALFPHSDDYYNHLLSGDITSFLNEKYIDKNINEEWGAVNAKSRIKYHESEIERHKMQIELLKEGRRRWASEGNGVE